MDAHFLSILWLNALQYGLLLFLIASGLTLIFGTLGVINLAHGSLYMLGAYVAYALTGKVAQLWGGNYLATLLIGILIVLALGYLLEWVFFSYLYDRGHLQQVLMTYGLILIFEELRSLFAGNDVHSVPIPEFLQGSVSLGGVIDYPIYRFAVMLACLVVIVGLYMLIQKTRLGMQIRAGADNRMMTRALGIKVSQLFRAVFALGVALAALAGMLAAPISTVYPGMGNEVLIISFVIVVIGGIGSVSGALIAALAVATIDTFSKVLIPDFASVTVYALLAIVLLYRPQGIFGRA